MAKDTLKWGITTGSCAALAAKAAALLLVKGERVDQVEIPLPDGSRFEYQITQVAGSGDSATATVIKDAGDDPDVTHGSEIVVTVKANDSGDSRFFAGDGVGVVTKSGLAIPAGGAAINPGPRKMIAAALAEVSDIGFDVTVAVPEGKKLAEKTFNPRLGIVGGISILGTSGRVRPFSAPALRDALKCSLDVAIAAQITRLVLVPGNMGNKAAQSFFAVAPEQIVDVSNEWGFMLGEVEKYPFEQLLMVGHPGKLAKLAQEQWQTHSGQSESAVSYVAGLAQEFFGIEAQESNTVEEVFMDALSRDQRQIVGDRVAADIQEAVRRTFPRLPVPTVVLINLKRQLIGEAEGTQPWKKR